MDNKQYDYTLRAAELILIWNNPNGGATTADLEELQLCLEQSTKDVKETIFQRKKEEITGDSKLFIDKLINGECKPEDIDYYIEVWHESGEEETRQIFEFLGMTEHEYARYVEGSYKTLEEIAQDRNLPW